MPHRKSKKKKIKRRYKSTNKRKTRRRRKKKNTKRKSRLQRGGKGVCPQGRDDSCINYIIAGHGSQILQPEKETHIERIKIPSWLELIWYTPLGSVLLLPTQKVVDEFTKIPTKIPTNTEERWRIAQERLKQPIQAAQAAHKSELNATDYICNLICKSGNSDKDFEEYVSFIKGFTPLSKPKSWELPENLQGKLFFNIYHSRKSIFGRTISTEHNLPNSAVDYDGSVEWGPACPDSRISCCLDIGTWSGIWDCSKNIQIQSCVCELKTPHKPNKDLAHMTTLYHYLHKIKEYHKEKYPAKFARIHLVVCRSQGPIQMVVSTTPPFIAREEVIPGLIQKKEEEGLDMTEPKTIGELYDETPLQPFDLPPMREWEMPLTKQQLIEKQYFEFGITSEFIEPIDSILKSLDPSLDIEHLFKFEHKYLDKIGEYITNIKPTDIDQLTAGISEIIQPLLNSYMKVSNNNDAAGFSRSPGSSGSPGFLRI